MRSKLTGLSLAAFLVSSLAIAQEATVGELKAKGATVLSAEEVKGLVTGATVRYDGPKFTGQMQLDPSGSIAGSSQKRVAAAGRPSTFGGKWRMNDNAQWCVTVEVRGFTEPESCRAVLKMGDKYYLTLGPAIGEKRPAYEMSVSK